MISVVLTHRELVNSRETVYTGGNEINMLDNDKEIGCDREFAKGANTMTERPILFNAEMVRAVLDGRKTQTRRVVKPQPDEDGLSRDAGYPFMWYDTSDIPRKCPYGQPGDELWVKETWGCWGYWDMCTRNGKPGYQFINKTDAEHPVMYDATDSISYTEGRVCRLGYHKRPSIYLPRTSSRIQLRVTDVRVERVQEISDYDALSEGIERSDWEYSCEPYRNYSHPRMAPGHNCSIPRASFATLWNSINEKRGYGWDANPWVWVVEFERKEQA